jgi:hypothetical protein
VYLKEGTCHKKEGLRGQFKPGVDSNSNVSVCSQLTAAAVNTAVLPGVCTVHALLRGGSRINHRRAGVLSLEGCPLVHSVFTPLT